MFCPSLSWGDDSAEPAVGQGETLLGVVHVGMSTVLFDFFW